jgi:CheY-like chemotaxis protein
MVIQGSAELLELGNLTEDDLESIQLITHATQSAVSLTARLLSFSGQSRLESTLVDLKETIAHLRPLFKSALTSAIELRISIPEDVWNIEIDAGAFEQAIINLVVNSRDAIPEGGRLDITCENYVAQRNVFVGPHDLRPGRYVCISLTDTGIGMSEQVLAQACEPFFTTKEVGKGTGLGLSTVYGFARQSGGTMEITSKPGKGCTVRLYLPVGATGEQSVVPAKRKTLSAVRQGVKILVVEDVPDLRLHVEKVLRLSGFDVTSAPDARTALTLLESGADFEILFTDVIMPGGMSGVQLARATMTVAPKIKVLLTTGYTAESLEKPEASEEREFRKLTKPYKTADLIQALNDLLGCGASGGRPCPQKPIGAGDV